ncbi:MAG TPA: DUF4197 domain-containing protein [Candidatus Dormibacteraeota bacterium]|jgi:hypothetical protein|nr:DUF4197 domain-containing protein [Candidatus Dormibacteraeota bacterium]
MRRHRGSRHWSGWLIVAAVLFVMAGPAGAQWDKLLKGLGGQGSAGAGLSDAKIGAGLKEALQVATEKTVSLTGKTDGYFANQAIKILMPEKLRSFETGLRAVGYGGQIDELVLGMNRAAERAAPQARQIFFDAIGDMSFDDARKLLNGGDTAATEYFRGKTTPRLTTAFRPVVEQSMSQVGVSRQYKDLVGRFDSIPFAKSQAFDLDGYVVDRGLGGLFTVLGEQEKQIRTNPTARATDLLKEVFKR